MSLSNLDEQVGSEQSPNYRWGDFDPFVEFLFLGWI